MSAIDQQAGIVAVLHEQGNFVTEGTASAALHALVSPADPQGNDAFS